MLDVCTFTNQNRQVSKEALNDQLDVLVIGGGITGAGIALDAATRGYKVAVLDMQDFAAGTSSRSTKLIHGGLRYLKNFEVKLVSEVGKEREVVYQNGPHITTPEWMMLPFYKKGTFGPLSTNIGLRIYDRLARVKKLERRQMLSRKETLKREPLLKEEGLRGSGYYVEYKTDDARLTIEVIKKAVEKGALAFNYMKVDQLLYNDGRVTGVKVRDLITDEAHEIRSHQVINATGPWVDDVRMMDQSKRGKQLFHTKGVHLVFSQSKFPLRQAIYFDTPDGRMVFAIPRDGKTYVGTTDTQYEGDLTSPTVTEADIDYIMNAIGFMFPEVFLSSGDIESTWAGIRPLIYEEGKDPSEISRKDEMIQSDSGLISIAGGKLTGYRKMSQQVMNLVSRRLSENTGKPYQRSQTKRQPIAGGEVGGSRGFAQYIQEKIREAEEHDFPKKLLLRWINRYGANTDQIMHLYQTAPNHIPIAKEVYAELIYCLEHEAIYKPVDFFTRRTGALFFDIDWVIQHKEGVIQVMKNYLGWDLDTTVQYTRELEEEMTTSSVGMVELK
ncbi:glycerol-3-phosphate dehydrogenase/oxidase [Alkalibacillus aidingensis]|uniref:glycerol-3-phosphate dehydrogenase/oxidase n=1 Tax=Alkalibacillus aidingensis TaxID=2747607 RepID=UPI0016617BA8|nr:glycerol-3-phosphate dehydrogenase/oxidase [Alkalibacillus aidingensis]